MPARWSNGFSPGCSATRRRPSWSTSASPGMLGPFTYMRRSLGDGGRERDSAARPGLLQLPRRAGEAVPGRTLPFRTPRRRLARGVDRSLAVRPAAGAGRPGDQGDQLGGDGNLVISTENQPVLVMVGDSMLWEFEVPNSAGSTRGCPRSPSWNAKTAAAPSGPSPAWRRSTVPPPASGRCGGAAFRGRHFGGRRRWLVQLHRHHPHRRTAGVPLRAKIRWSTPTATRSASATAEAVSARAPGTEGLQLGGRRAAARRRAGRASAAARPIVERFAERRPGRRSARRPRHRPRPPSSPVRRCRPGRAGCLGPARPRRVLRRDGPGTGRASACRCRRRAGGRRAPAAREAPGSGCGPRRRGRGPARGRRG